MNHLANPHRQGSAVPHEAHVSKRDLQTLKLVDTEGMPLAAGEARLRSSGLRV